MLAEHSVILHPHIKNKSNISDIFNTKAIHD